MKEENAIELFLNKEVVYNIKEAVAFQSRVYQEFCNVFEKEEAAMQTSIFMSIYGKGGLGNN